MTPGTLWNWIRTSALRSVSALPALGGGQGAQAPVDWAAESWGREVEASRMERGWASREGRAHLEHEGHALPPRVVHMQHGGGEGLGAALLVHDGRLLEVPGRVAAADVLAGAERVEGKRLHALEHLKGACWTCHGRGPT